MTPHFAPTWTLGPNRAYPELQAWPSPWQMDIQLQDLQPGEFWIPAIEGNITTNRTLSAAPAAGTWRFRNTNFAWFMRHRYTPGRLEGTFQLSRVDIECFHRPTASGVFLFIWNTATAQKLINQLTDAAGNYSFGGTARMAWIGRP